MTKILIVDDEPTILNLVASYMRSEGYEVHTASDGYAAIRAVKAYQPEIVILDIMLPGMDGLEVLSNLRKNSDVYVILLTARTEETDKIIGLSAGADDYVTKPFSPRELTARVKAALRRLATGNEVQDQKKFLRSERIVVDRNARQVNVDNHLIALTALEYDLLTVLMENPGRVLTREQLLEKVWGYDYYGEPRVVDVHLGHIRQKLGTDIIATVRGVGYRFDGSNPTGQVEENEE